MSAGIPTVYAGTRFRSRLEARWAVFFDQIEWPWNEPLELKAHWAYACNLTQWRPQA